MQRHLLEVRLANHTTPLEGVKSEKFAAGPISCIRMGSVSCSPEVCYPADSYLCMNDSSDAVSSFHLHIDFLLS